MSVEGWARPLGSTRAHYYERQRVLSLCAMLIALAIPSAEITGQSPAVPSAPTRVAIRAGRLARKGRLK